MSAENTIHRRRADDWTKPATPGMTPEQLGILLDDIARMAKNVERLSTLLMSHLGAGEGDDETFLSAIEAMAQRIGWAADMASDRIEGAGSAVYGDAEKWMMPPMFHHYQAKAEGVAS